MTAISSVSRDRTSDILRSWQAEAIKRWKHIDPVVLAVNGPIWKAMSGVLALLNASAYPSAERTLPASTRSDSLSQTSSGSDHVSTIPTDVAASVFDAQSEPLASCAEQLALLPVSWADLRSMLRTLTFQMRCADGGCDGREEEKRALFVDGLMEALSARVADIEIVKLEQQIASHQEQTLATQHLAERFLGNASHELRTPLTAIMGFAELLLEEVYGELTPQQAERVSNIENSAQNLNEIISNMLDLLHIRAGKLTLQYRPVDVTAMLQHLYEILMPLAGRKNVKFDLEIAAELGTVEMAENIVRHVVYHLLSSALRATPAGGEVTLAARRNAPWLILEARDTALHLPPEAVDNMLSPFPRLENLPTRGYEGWEVGLPLVRRYVELHSGELYLESLPEKGTVFTVRLPLTRPREGQKPSARDGRRQN